jgi:hypothetical protein
MTTRFLPCVPACVIAAAAAALLAACGGGGGDSADTTVSQETAESAAANTLAIPASAAEAGTESLKTAQAVVAGGQASQTVACAGGGTAIFTVTGASVAGATNGQLDAGETYSLQFSACRGSAGAASIDGAMTLVVTAAAAGALTVQTTTQGLTVVLPLRTLTWNGSSTLAQTVVVSGATTTTSTRWTAAQIQLTSLRNARSSSFTLSGVDVTRSVVVTNGVLAGSSGSTALTLAATLPNGAWTAAIATQGNVSYDAAGVPIAGTWAIALPHNAIGVTVTPGSAVVSVDHGPDGTIDRTWTFTTGALAAEAA